jgi:translation initiation factor 3 subunit I
MPLVMRACADLFSSLTSLLACCSQVLPHPCTQFPAAIASAPSSAPSSKAFDMRPYLLKGHERPLTQVKYNREGDLLVSCAKNLQPCLWFADDGSRIGTYEGHNGAVWTCEISWDSSRLITGSADQTVRVWDLPTGQELHQIKMSEPCRATALSIGEDMLAFTTDSFMGSPPQIHLVDADLTAPENMSNKPEHTIDCPRGRITRVFFTEFNRVLLTSHDGGFIRRWDVETGKMLEEAQVRSWLASFIVKSMVRCSGSVPGGGRMQQSC